jgi:hypothetical protein
MAAAIDRTLQPAGSGVLCVPDCQYLAEVVASGGEPLLVF